MATPHGKSRRERKAERRERLRALGVRKAAVRNAPWFLTEDEPAELAIGPQRQTTGPKMHPSASMRRMRASLLPLLADGPGLFLIIGDSGVGKSAFVTWIAQELERDGYRVVSGSCPLAAVRGLAETLDGGAGRLAARQRLLRQALSSGDARPPVVAVDDAELVSPSALLALLPLLEESDRSPARLRVILVGRPALSRCTEAADLARLVRHIRFRGRLTGWDEGDVVALLQRRLGENGASGDVAAALVRYAEGRPGVVAFLCERAIALAGNEDTICCSHVEQAAAILRPARITRPQAMDDARSLAPIVAGSRHWRALGAAAGTMAAAMVGLWLAVSSFDVGHGVSAPRQAPELAASRPIVMPHVAEDRSTPAARTEAPAQAPTIVATNAVPPTDHANPVAETGIPPAEAAAVPPPLPPAIAVPPPEAIAALPTRDQPPAIVTPVEKPHLAEAAPKPGPPPVENIARKRVLPTHVPTRTVVAKLEPRPRNVSKERPRAAPAPLAAASPQAAPPPQRHDEAGAQVQLAAQQLASAEPQCRAYVSAVNFAGRATNVSGVACRAPSGEWWLMDQRTE